MLYPFSYDLFRKDTLKRAGLRPVADDAAISVAPDKLKDQGVTELEKGFMDWDSSAAPVMIDEVPINLLIAEFLRLLSKISEGYFRFLCPLCSEFLTAINSKTNLARCFRCEKNFNPTDMVMQVNHCNFKEAVEYFDSFVILRRHLPFQGFWGHLFSTGFGVI